MAERSPILVAPAKLVELTPRGRKILKAASLGNDRGGFLVSIDVFEDAMRQHRKPGIGGHLSRVLKAMGFRQCVGCVKRATRLDALSRRLAAFFVCW